MRKWQIHGHNYIIQLICWGAQGRKPRVPCKTAHTAGPTEEGASFFLLWGSAEAGIGCSGFLEIPVLYSSWDKLLCHTPSARAYHRAWPYVTQLCTPEAWASHPKHIQNGWKTQEGTTKNGPCAFPSLPVKFSGFLLPRPHFPEESES